MKRERDDHRAAGELRRIAREVAKPARRIDLHEEGSVTLRKLWVHDWLDRPDVILDVWTVGLLAVLLGCWENRSSVFYSGRIEGVGDDAVLVIDRRSGPGQHLDDEERLVGWERSLDHLQTNGFVKLEKTAAEIRVRKGSRLRKATQRAA